MRRLVFLNNPVPDLGVVLSEVHAPFEVHELAGDELLGTLLEVHDPRALTGRSRAWLIVLGLPGLTLLPFAVLFLSQGVGWAAVLSLALTVGYLGAAGRILIRDVIPGYGKILYRYEKGLVLATGRGAMAFPWDAVREVRLSGARTGSTDEARWRFSLVREDGAEAEIGAEFPGVAGLVEVASAAVTERVLPKYICRVEGGGTVHFGPFALTREGITKDGEKISWDDVAAVGIGNGMVYLDRADREPGMLATAGEIPNLVAFVELTDHVRMGRTA
jgi:hypothetical protein